MNSTTSSNLSFLDCGPVYCEKFRMQVISIGVFAGSNPTQSTLPLLLLQLGLVSSIAGFLEFLFRPLGVPKHVTDILSGILLGPSGVGRNKKFFETLFAPKGAMVLDVYETICMILFSFFVGLRTDVKVIKRAGGLALTMGILCSLLPQIINAIVLRSLTKDIPDDSNLGHSLSVVAGLEGLINFHVVFLTLTDQKFVNTEVGRVALSSSMISGFFSWIMIILRRLVLDIVQGRTTLVIVNPVSRGLMLLCILYVIRPLMFWMITKTPEGKTLKQSYVCWMILMLFGIALYSEVNGMHHVFSSILLGLAVPDGSPLQSGLVNKLEGFVYGVFMPSFIMNVGRRVDIYKLERSLVGKVEVLVATSFLSKLAASLLASTFWDMALTDAFLIGLLVTCQGIFDIQFFTIAEKIESLSTECFTVMVIMAIVLPTIVRPIVAYIYNPSSQFRTAQKRGIHATKYNLEFKILACIHQEDTVPTLIDVLEASNPTRKSPIVAYVLDLVELVGQSIPLFISHKLKTSPSSRSNRTQRIITAFYHYELQNQGLVTVHCFTSVSPFETIHNDICLLALEKSTSLIILSQGMFTDSSIKEMNNNVLENAPCTVGILVDCKGLTESSAAVRPWLCFHVCLIFIGGPDDREALIYCSRMCEHANITLTIIHISEALPSELDLDAMDRFRDTNVYNNRVFYNSESVKEGTDTVRVLQSLNNIDCDLIVVGRKHDAQSSAMTGLADWGEKPPELGVIGDILVSPDIESKAAVMILQAHSSHQEHELLTPPLTPTKNLQYITTVDPDTELSKLRELNPELKVPS
ncbi:Cation/H(+) antiporter like [Heracleum sosnowskyi]|uniref:Cation/H(+) antiporter like n=1 Tax=Heracleum sosnowskyi TaxID=360622 RepID=A0AAD8LWV0_9APIA|nr:Cation/H(+) antiporter like [Heracleum sosnowskyi]